MMAHPLIAESLVRYYSAEFPNPPKIGSPEEKSVSCKTSHIVTVDWTKEFGFGTPILWPFSQYVADTSDQINHYGASAFEGLKLYCDEHGELWLFRPLENCKRFARSIKRLELGAPDPDELLKLMIAFCEVDGWKWCQPGHFLYLRPHIFPRSTGYKMQAATAATIAMELVCMPDMEKIEGGMRLLISRPEHGPRTAHGGTGSHKIGPNYAPTAPATEEAARKGCHQVLWCSPDMKDGPRLVTATGGSNVFIVWKNRQSGDVELVTPQLDEDALILGGITRRSIIELAKERCKSGGSYLNGRRPLEVKKRMISLEELVEAHKNGLILEMFASGTAYSVPSISVLVDEADNDLNILVPGEGESYARLFSAWLQDIRYGRDELKLQEKWTVRVEAKGHPTPKLDPKTFTILADYTDLVVRTYGNFLRETKHLEPLMRALTVASARGETSIDSAKNVANLHQMEDLEMVFGILQESMKEFIGQAQTIFTPKEEK